MKRREIEDLIPWVFRRTLQPGSPLAVLLDIMEALHAPSERVLETLDVALDPRRTGDAFVPYLARWVDLERLLEDESGRIEAVPGRPLLPTGLGYLRELVAAAADLSKWRGTAHGLQLFLETATGTKGFELDEQVPGPDGRPRPFHLRVRIPEAAARYRSLIDRIVRMEKPAYVTYELELAEPRA
jgi:phage tail-like protein